MNPYETPGAFSWSELMTSDPEAAGEFYGKLFGWKIEKMRHGQRPYHVVKIGEARRSAASWACRPTRRRHAADVGLLRHGRQPRRNGGSRRAARRRAC